MKPEERHRIHKAVEYIRHSSKYSRGGFHWDEFDVMDNIGSVMAEFGICIDSFTEEGIARLKMDLLEVAEKQHAKEMARMAEAESW